MKAKALGVTLEYAGIQCPDDKPYIESFFGHYKTEEVYRTNYATRAEAQVGWQLYRIWYETERVHESLDYQTPHQRLTRGRGGSGCTEAADGVEREISQVFDGS
ncbi:MAG: transposase [Candidatus Omnitrophica bacterium]|nr:transposase [Candidatus Omnitrophota bacterium]